MIKGVIFDMDGVLVDNRDMHIEAFRIICEKYNTPFRGYDDFMPLFGMGNEEILRILMPEVIKKMDWHELADEKEALYREIFEKTVAPVKGLREFLGALKKEGYKTAVGSSGSKENVNFVLTKCGITDFFDVIVNGDMVTRCKPDPEIYLTVAEKMGLDPTECAVAEDAVAGIQAARRAGCHVIALATTFPREQHTDYDILLDNFTQITTGDIAKLG